MNWWLNFATNQDVVATLIAAVLGFGGVVATLILQHRANVLRDQLRVESHRRGVAAAFAVEIRAIGEYAKNSVIGLGGPELTTFLVPIHLPFVLFDALKGELHALSTQQIEKVVACYVWLPEITARLRMLAGAYSNPDGVSVVLLAQHAHIYEYLMNHLHLLASEAHKVLEPV